MVQFYKHKIGKQYMWTFRIGWFKWEWCSSGDNFMFRFEINNWDSYRDNEIEKGILKNGDS